MVSENIHTYPKKGRLKNYKGKVILKAKGKGLVGEGGDLNLKDLSWGWGYFLEPDNIDIKLIEYLAVIYLELGSNHCVHTCSSVDRSRCYFCMPNFFFAAAGKK